MTTTRDQFWRRHIAFYRSQFAGNPCARCTVCGSVWAYWDDIEDLEHDCQE